ELPDCSTPRPIFYTSSASVQGNQSLVIIYLYDHDWQLDLIREWLTAWSIGLMRLTVQYLPNSRDLRTIRYI
ncbi:MAG: hypothetical protein K8F91_21125, partial [Candidatus Obscuribacterales bacterium]|nr:hypothetical protein [Candidatus Obscuribacterales bacterium]